MAVNAGARLDRLPVSSFHWRILGLIGAGMFLDAFDIYLQGGVLGALVSSGWSTAAMNANFISTTFAGMVVGAWLAGVWGDRFGRRFSYQMNLLVFGTASLAGALAPTMLWLTVARFFMGIGLGAEIVVGYVLLSEFVPPGSRGRWGTGLAVITNSALFFSALIGRFVIPNFGWRWMFVLVGVGAQYARPQYQAQPLPPPVVVEIPVIQKPSLATLFSRGLAMRTIIGCTILITMNTAIYGFIAFLPTFMVKQGINIVTSLNYTTLMSFGGPCGALVGMWLGDRIGRKSCIIWFSLAAVVFGALYPQTTDPNLLMLIGFMLVASVYVLVAIAWGLYVPELFPTEVRMRGAGFCNTAGRMMTILTPQLTVPLFAAFGVSGVISMVAGLLILQVIMVALFGIETRKKALEALVPRGAGASSGLAPGPASADAI